MVTIVPDMHVIYMNMQWHLVEMCEIPESPRHCKKLLFVL